MVLSGWTIGSLSSLPRSILYRGYHFFQSWLLPLVFIAVITRSRKRQAATLEQQGLTATGLGATGRQSILRIVRV